MRKTKRSQRSVHNKTKAASAKAKSRRLSGLLYIGLTIVVLALAGFLYLLCQPKGYPIDSKISTTRERTITPISVPTGSPQLLPTDIAKYSQYGYGKWQFGPGLGYDKRLDLMPASYKSTPVAPAAKLLNFFAITDIHITDKESPAQAIALRNQGAKYSAYSGVMLYSTQVLDAAVQTINSLNKKTPFDFGISLGDAVNSTQYNETRWYVDVLDGKTINPDSGTKDDPVPGKNNDYQDKFKAAGLDKSIPWYQVVGNHDHFWTGFLSPNDYLKQTITSNKILNLGNPFINPLGADSRGYYMGSIDGRTQYGSIIGAGKVTDFATNPTVPAADKNRHSLSTSEWMNEFFKTSSNPKGHGFSKADAAKGFANYSFMPKSSLPIKVIALDDTQSNSDSNDPIANGFGKGSYGYGHGELDTARCDWLISELDKGQAAGQLMIIAAHEPVGVEKVPSMMAWNPELETKLIAKLHTYPNLIMWVAGHRHQNTITAMKSPDTNHPELGFWQIETSSLRDFPQEFRTIQVNRNTDNTISIFATDVDPAVADGSLAATSRSYAIAADQTYNAESPMTTSGSYNAELVKQLTPEMQAKISNLGTAIKN
jgi:metallophosphoesterase (TIGR03768 family)